MTATVVYQTYTTQSNERNNQQQNYPFSFSSSDSVPSQLDMYQQILIESRKVIIRTLVPPTIRDEPYRKSMVTTLFFHQISVFSYSSSVTISNLMMTILFHFYMSTGYTTNEKEHATDHACQAVSILKNMQAVSFFVATGKPISIKNPAKRPDYTVFF